MSLLDSVISAVTTACGTKSLFSVLAVEEIDQTVVTTTNSLYTVCGYLIQTSEHAITVVDTNHHDRHGNESRLVRVECDTNEIAEFGGYFTYRLLDAIFYSRSLKTKIKDGLSCVLRDPVVAIRRANTIPMAGARIHDNEAISVLVDDYTCVVYYPHYGRKIVVGTNHVIEDYRDLIARVATLMITTY